MDIQIAMPQMGNDLFRRYMKQKYVKCLKKAGAQVRWIDLTDPDRAAREAVTCDGLLMPGGVDISPSLYGQQPTDRCGKPDPIRDAGEMAILKAFYPTGKPIFCICRGMQLMNVFFGGSLHQDIKDLQQVRHSHFPTKNWGTHGIRVEKQTRLGAMLDPSMPVNSLHHQAADRLGEGLAVCARREDGFVEALEAVDHPFFRGVQWHPEHLRRGKANSQALFDAFVTACKKEK